MMKMSTFLMNCLSYLNVLGVLVLTLSAVALGYYIQWRLKRRHLMEVSSKIPLAKNKSYLPIIGHAHHFIGDTERIVNSVAEFCASSNYAVTAHLGHRVFHTIVRPEDFEVVLNSSKALGKDDLYRFTVPLAGNGIFNLDVDTWKWHRKLIMPTLNQKVLNSFVPIFAEQCQVMVDLLKDEIGKDVDIYQFVSKCTLDCVLESSMGVKMNCQTTDFNGIEEKVTRGMDLAMIRIFNVIYHFDFIYNLTSLAREEKKIVSSFKSFINKIVVDRKREYLLKKKLAEEQPEAEVVETRKRKAFLDHLIQLTIEENTLSNEAMGDEVRTFVIAAWDTSGTVVGFVLMCIAMFPDVQQKVFEEVIEVVGYERDVEDTDLSQMKYMEMVIKEMMRIFPVAPIIVRKVSEDLDLETCTLAKGVGLVLSILVLHRNPLYFKDPLKFIPERFTPEESAKRHPYSYLPFSGGQRNCIGPKFGMMLVKCMVAAVVRKFVVTTEYKSVEEVRIKQSVVIKPAAGFKLGLIPRRD